MTSRRAALIGVLALALAIRALLFFGGVRGSDAYLYAEFAHRIADGSYDPVVETAGLGRPDAGELSPDRLASIAPASAALRFVVLAPTAIAYRLFGVGDAASALFPLAASLATVWLVWLLGTRLADAPTGVIAALLLAAYPLDIRSASVLGPDSFLPVLTGGAFAVTLLAAVPLGATRPWLAALAAMGAGALVGLATMTREIGVLIVVPLGVILLANTRARLLPALALGVLIPLAVEALYLGASTGDPLYRVRVGRLLTEQMRQPGVFGITDPAYYVKGMLGLDLAGLAAFGLLFYLVAAGLVIGWRSAPAAAPPLALWLVVILGYLSVGSVSPTRYVPVVKSVSYVSFITVPAVILAALALRPLWPVRTKWLAAAMVVVSATSLYGAYRLLVNTRNDARPYEVVAAAVGPHPERAIYTHHPRWSLFLNYFLRYRTGYHFMVDGPPAARLRDVARVSTPAEIRDAYVVAHIRYLAYDFQRNYVGRRPELPAFLSRPPDGWRVVLADHGHPSYNDVVLYYAPSHAD